MTPPFKDPPASVWNSIAIYLFIKKQTISKVIEFKFQI